MDHDSDAAAGRATTMTEDHETTTGEAHDGPDRGPRRLRRGPGGRVAGVCEGIGWYLQLDPTVVRVAFVLASFLAGVGLVAYGAAWLLIPRADDPSPEPLRLERGPRLVAGVLLAVALVAIVTQVGVVGPFGLDSGPGLLIAAVLVTAGVYLLTRSPVGTTPTTAFHMPPAGAVATPPATTTAPPRADVGPAFPTPPTPPPPPAPPAAGPDSPSSPAPPAAVRVTVLVLGAITLGAAILMALDLGDVLDAGTREYATLGLAVCGLGLVGSAFLGRARGLIPLTLLFGIVLAASVWVPSWWRDGIGDRTYTPTAVPAIEPSYELGIGEQELDLRGLDLAGTRQRIDARVGIGRLVLYVPADVDLDIHAHVGAGDIDLLGRQRDGIGQDELVFQQDVPGTAGLEIDADVSIGSVEIRHG